MGPPTGGFLPYVGAVAVMIGAAFLQAAVLPDRPGLAFVLSLGSGTIATIIVTRLGREF